MENRGVSLFRGHWAPHLCRTLLLVHFVQIYICIVCSASGRLYLPPNLIILPHGSLNGRAKKLLIANPESKITKSQFAAFQNPHKITVYFLKITKSQNLLFKIRTRECLVRFLDPHYVHSQSGNRTSECQTNYFNAFCPF